MTRMLRKGYSVAHVADAHGMTPEMVTRRYGHLSKRETTAALHETGDDLFNAVLLGGNEGERIKKRSLDSASKELKLLETSSAHDAPEMLPSEGSTLSS